MTMTDREADHLLGQMLDDIAAADKGDVATGWLKWWAHMPDDDKMLMAQRGAPRVLGLAAERGIRAGHVAFPRVGALYAAFTYEQRRQGDV